MGGAAAELSRDSGEVSWHSGELRSERDWRVGSFPPKAALTGKKIYRSRNHESAERCTADLQLVRLASRKGFGEGDLPSAFASLGAGDGPPKWPLWGWPPGWRTEVGSRRRDSFLLAGRVPLCHAKDVTDACGWRGFCLGVSRLSESSSVCAQKF